jgi:putative transposase
MKTGRRFRAELTEGQAQFAQQTADVCRAVWNTGLEQRREYRRRAAWMNYNQQAYELADAKNEHTWLREAPSHCLQQVLRDLDKACRRHGTLNVRWRSARRWEPSFRFPEGSRIKVEKLNRKTSQVRLPKLGWVKFRASRPLHGETVRSATLTRQGTKWFVSFLVDDGMATPKAHARPGTAVGVDRGVVVAVATSAGELFDQAFTRPGEERRALRLERKLARAAKGSANRIKTRESLGKLRTRERHRRRDFCLKIARQLVQENELVVLENLRVRDMTRRAQPIADPAKAGHYLPNRGSAKSGLNRAILSKGWYGFEAALTSASRYSGTQVEKFRQRSRLNAARRVGMWIRIPARAKRFSGAPTACVPPSTRISTQLKTYWPPDCWRCQPVETTRSSRATGNPRSRNQQETARNYCADPRPRLVSGGCFRPEDVTWQT